MTDDEPYGDARYMPNFRRLARRGTTFTNAFVSFPICCPARATFLTGQYAHNHGVKSNFGTTAAASRTSPTRRNAPRVASARRLRHRVRRQVPQRVRRPDPELVPPGWDDWHGLVDYSTYNYFNWAINDNGEVHYHGDREYAEALIELAAPASSRTSTALPRGSRWRSDLPADRVLRRRDQRDYQTTSRAGSRTTREGSRRRRPFFLYYSPIASHSEGDFEGIGGVRSGRPEPDPRPPERYAEAFDDVALPKDPSFNEADVSDKPETVSGRDRSTRRRSRT